MCSISRISIIVRTTDTTIRKGLTDAVGRKPEPVTEDAPALVAGVKGQKTMKPILLLTTAAAAAQHLLLLVPEQVGLVE